MSSEKKEYIDKDYGGDLGKAADAFRATKIYLYRSREGELNYKFIRDAQTEAAFLNSPYVRDPVLVWPK